MVNEGIIANALVTALASAGFLYVAAEIRRRRVATEKRALAAVLLFGIIGVHLAGASLRQLVAFAGAGDPVVQRAEEIIFFIVVVPATLSIVPLAYMATWALTGRELLTRIVTAGFLALSAVGIAAVFADGITGPDLSFWASEWTIDSPLAKPILGIITLTAFAGGAILLRAGHGVTSDAGRRARLVGWACIIYYAAFVGDALGEPGVWLLVERTVMAAAAFVGYQAYFYRRPPSAAHQPATH
jgi:hypothetical protein